VRLFEDWYSWRALTQNCEGEAWLDERKSPALQLIADCVSPRQRSMGIIPHPGDTPMNITDR
jgi:hypothetical protein